MPEEPQNAYEKVAAKVRDWILNRELKPNEKLPSEHELEREFRVSRITIRRALDILEEEHLITKKHGKGSFVSPNPIRRIPLLIDYARSVRTHAPNLRRELRLWKWISAPEWVAQQLGIRNGELVYYAERVDILDEKAVAYDNSYIVASFADKLTEEELVRVDFNDVWQDKSSFDIISCKQIIDAVSADEVTAEILKLSLGSPILKGSEIYFTHYNRPTGLFDNYYNPRYISLVSNFRWSSELMEDYHESRSKPST